MLRAVPVGCVLGLASLLSAQTEDVAGVTYEFQTGSVIAFNCPCCELLNTGGPVEGGFRLVPADAEAVLGEYYVVEDMKLVVPSELRPLALSGRGSYQRQGGPSPLEQMDLELFVDGEFTYGPSTSGQVVPVAVFPEISIQLASPFDGCGLSYVFTVVAAPGEPSPQFRRGDANVDGAIDVSDAVAVLGWLFQGQESPTCLGTVDANGDSSRDVSDAVFLLLFLFSGGRAPPAPGPESCGLSPLELEPCASYAACG